MGEAGPEYVGPRRGGNGGGVHLHSGAIQIDARGAGDGVEVKIRSAIDDLVSGLERHLNAIPAAHGA